jgi:hypothetical protein
MRIAGSGLGDVTLGIPELVEACEMNAVFTLIPPQYMQLSLLRGIARFPSASWP